MVISPVRLPIRELTPFCTAPNILNVQQCCNHRSVNPLPYLPKHRFNRRPIFGRQAKQLVPIKDVLYYKKSQALRQISRVIWRHWPDMTKGSETDGVGDGAILLANSEASDPARCHYRACNRKPPR